MSTQCLLHISESGDSMFKLSIWFLQRWLKKRQRCDETVFVISAKGWTFDNCSKHKRVLEE